MTRDAMELSAGDFWVISRRFRRVRSPGAHCMQRWTGGNHIEEYERATKQNDFVKWHNSNRGCVSCELTPANWTSHFRATPFVDKPGSPIETKAVYVVEQSRPGAQKA